jgi:two-component system nitrate/nitrite response regulator NarL
MRTQPFVTVLLGPDPLVREGLMRILRPAGFRIAASIARMEENVFISLPGSQPLLFIIDAGHDASAAIGQIRRIKEEFSTGQIAILAAHNHQTEVVAAFRAGASCYLTKAMASEVLVKSFELVMLGEAILPPSILAYLGEGKPCASEQARMDRETVAASLLEAGEDDVPRLSAREVGILQCLVQGDSNKAIARRINIAEATVKVHVKAILRKIRVHNRTQAAIWAIHRGQMTAAEGEQSLPLLPHPMTVAPELCIADGSLPDEIVVQAGAVDAGPSSTNGSNHRRRC